VADDVESSAPPRRFSVALLGGLRVGGRPRLGDRLVRLAVIGGMDLDLTGAELTAGRLTIVKVSLIGGIDVRVPTDARVDVHSFAIGGSHVEDGRSRDGTGEGAAAGPTISIWSFGLLGGTKVRRRPA
jgi:hypothetical protein